MLLKLGQYLKKYEVNKFECAAFSCFPDERETLFFGGETVLKIKGALQWVDGVLMKYDRFMEPINAFSRMMNGLSLKEQEILKKKKSQRTMKVLIKDILRSLVLKQHECESPKYIQDLVLFHHQSTHRIRLLYDEMISEYQWLDCILKNGQSVDMVNIAILFSHSEHIIFRMAENTTLSETESQRIIDDLVTISGMTLSVTIGLVWPSKIPENTRTNIRNALIGLYNTNWQYQFEAQLSVWFIPKMEEVQFGLFRECVQFKAQQLFQECVQNMISVLSIKPKSECSKMSKIKENVSEKLDVEMHKGDHGRVKVEPEDDGVILTIYQYSNLLHDALQKYVDSYSGGSPLMTFCFEMAFFVTAPNHAFIQNEANKYLSALQPYCIQSIAHLIYSFVRDEGLKWVPFEDKKHDRYLQQINFSEDHHIVDFKNARNDCINVRTIALPMTGKIAINVLCGYKGDEMWFGLIECTRFNPADYVKAKKRTLLYYGARGRNRPAKDAKCSEYWGKCDGSDCEAGGSIQGGPQRVIKHPIKAYVAGDWLTFQIDFDAKTVEFYHDGQFVYKSESTGFPKEQCYFMGQVDAPKDWFYIEQCIPQ